MNTKNYISRVVGLLDTLRSKKNNSVKTVEESINSRSDVNTSVKSNNAKKASDSLLYMMYSKENETLFI